MQMPRLQIIFQTIVWLTVLVMSVEVAELVIEDVVNKVLTGVHSHLSPAEKWVQIFVTSAAIACVGGGVAFFRYRASRAGKALHSQNEAMDHIAEAVICTDSHGYIQHCNKGAEKLYGYSAEEAIRMKSSKLYDVDPTELHKLYSIPLLKFEPLDFTCKMRRK
jgi:PAS domain-containing protein